MNLEHIAGKMHRQYGKAFAKRWLEQQRASAEKERARREVARQASLLENYQESLFEHESHVRAAELLEPHRESLGEAFWALHFLARWAVENATEDDPAPHLMVPYWVLEEATGKSERTLRRHLVEDGHRWSEAVRGFIDVRHNYGTMLDGKDERGKNKYRKCITSMVIRFFPRGRLSKEARVKRWGRRDLLLESDEGRTRATRPVGERGRYQRKKGQMSAYSSLKEQCQENNWFLVKLGQTVSDRTDCKNFGSLYADIPKNYVLDALRGDLALGVEKARARGASTKRARSKWVDTAARVLASRHDDHRALPHHVSENFVTHFDGFTDLWRRALWTAIKAEMYGGTGYGWALIDRMIALASDAKREGFKKPSAWAWSRVREEMEALRRDYGSGMAGALEA